MKAGENDIEPDLGRVYRGGFQSQLRVFDLVMQELQRGATKVSAHPARAVCFLWLS